MGFKPDFMQMLYKYGKLPFSNTTTALEELRKLKDELEKARSNIEVKQFQESLLYLRTNLLANKELLLNS